jgi:hypothetical protein
MHMLALGAQKPSPQLSCNLHYCTGYVQVGRRRGDVFTFPDIAWRAAVMAAERGVAAAAASVAHGYATGQVMLPISCATRLK